MNNLINIKEFTNLVYDYKFKHDQFLFNKLYLNKFINSNNIDNTNLLIKQYLDSYYIDCSKVEASTIVYNRSSIFLENNNLTNEINSIVEDIKKNYKSVKAIILIGSIARNKYKKNSDIDFLIVSTRKIKKIKLNFKTNRKVDFIYRTTKRIKKNYQNFDELIIWSLKYGISYYDDNFFRNFFIIENLQDYNNIIKNKNNQIKKYINFLQNNIDNLSDNGIRGKLKIIYYFYIRYTLYQNNFIPKSKPELEEQLNEHNLSNNQILHLKQYDNAMNLNTTDILKLLNNISLKLSNI